MPSPRIWRRVRRWFATCCWRWPDDLKRIADAGPASAGRRLDRFGNAGDQQTQYEVEQDDPGRCGARDPQPHARDEPLKGQRPEEGDQGEEVGEAAGPG